MTSNETVITPSFEGSILQLLPDPMIWVRPTLDTTGAVIDFEVGYSNKAAEKGVNHPKGSLTGLRILQDGVPSQESAPGNFKHFLDVFTSGEVKEYTFQAHHSNRVYETVRQPHNGGVLSITRDRGAQREAERKEQATRRMFQSIVDSSPNGIVVFDAIRDQNNHIIDFAPLHFNQKRNELLGLTPEEGATFSFRQILQALNAESVFEQYVDVVEKGTTIQREQFVEQSKKWISISTVKLDAGFLALLSDITELKHSHQVLLQQSEYLINILNASLSAVFTCEAVRDETGTIIDLRYTQINEMYKKMIGKTEEEVIGKTMLELFPTAVTTGAFATHCKVIETGTSARFDLRYQGEGLNAWFDISSVKVGDDGVVITFADVLEQKTAIEKIEEQKNLLDNILTSSSNGISVSEMIRDINGIVIDAKTILVNEAAVRHTGLAREIYLSKTAVELDSNIIQSPYYQKCLQTLESGEPFITQYFLESTGKWLELSVSRMDQDHLIHIFTDITSIKEVQLQQERLVEELKRSNRYLEDFAHAASHDMKEPLRKIRTFTDRIKQSMGERMNEQEAKMFERVEVSSERMQLLVDDLLEFSFVSERPQEMELVDLYAKIQKVLSDLDLLIEEKKARISISSLPTVKGNKRQLQQLFHNLLTNALKYSKPDVPPEIIIQSRVVRGREIKNDLHAGDEDKMFQLLEVRDNGIGFEQQYAEQIFGMFQRLHGKAEYSGTGVGLSITRKVVENHNGYIWATGKPDKGATFHVLLPC